MNVVTLAGVLTEAPTLKENEEAYTAVMQTSVTYQDKPYLFHYKLHLGKEKFEEICDVLQKNASLTVMGSLISTFSNDGKEVGLDVAVSNLTFHGHVEKEDEV